MNSPSPDAMVSATLITEARAKAIYTDRNYDNRSLGELYRRLANSLASRDEEVAALRKEVERLMVVVERIADADYVNRQAVILKEIAHQALTQEGKAKQALEGRFS